jgi:hypothetical protein
MHGVEFLKKRKTGRQAMERAKRVKRSEGEKGSAKREKIYCSAEKRKGRKTEKGRWLIQAVESEKMGLYIPLGLEGLFGRCDDVL